MSQMLDWGLGMKYNWRWLAGGVFLCLLIVVVWQWRQSTSGPTHHGKSVRKLVRNAVIGSGSAGQIGSIGPDAVPYLINWLDYEQSWIRKASGAIRSKLPLPTWLAERLPANASQEEVRRTTVLILGELRKDAREAVPHLMELLMEPETTYHRDILYSLTAIQPQSKRALSELKRYLRSAPSLDYQLRAVRAICSSKKDAALAFEYFDRALESGNPQHIRSAIRNFDDHIIGDTSAETEEKITKRFARILESSKPRVRDAAARVLQDHGEKLSLILTNRHLDLHVRVEAAEALRPGDVHRQSSWKAAKTSRKDEGTLEERVPALLEVLNTSVETEKGKINQPPEGLTEAELRRWKYKNEKMERKSDEFRDLRGNVALALCNIDFDTAQSAARKAVITSLSHVVQDNEFAPWSRVQAIRYLGRFDSLGTRERSLLKKISRQEGRRPPFTKREHERITKAAQEVLEKFRLTSETSEE